MCDLVCPAYWAGPSGMLQANCPPRASLVILDRNKECVLEHTYESLQPVCILGLPYAAA